MTDKYNPIPDMGWDNPQIIDEIAAMAQDLNLQPAQLTNDLMLFAIVCNFSEYYEAEAPTAILKIAATRLAFQFAELLALALTLADPDPDESELLDDKPKGLLN